MKTANIPVNGNIAVYI